MDYRTKDVIGRCLEMGGIAGLVLSVKYDAPFLAYIADSTIYILGQNLRNRSLRDKILKQNPDLSDLII